MPTLDEVLDAITPPAAPPRHGVHSPLYEVLWDAYDDLRLHLLPPRRPDWRHVAARLAQRNVLDGKGKPPTGERTRKVFWKVDRDKEVVAAAPPRRRRPRLAQPAPVAPVPQPVAPPVLDRSDEDAIGFKFAGDLKKQP